MRDNKYAPPTPLVTVFNKIEDLRDLAEATHNSYTEIQLLNIGLQTLKESGDFTEGLKLWYQKPPAEHTWINF